MLTAPASTVEVPYMTLTRSILTILLIFAAATLRAEDWPQCLSASDGKLVWRTNYTKDFGATFIGEKGNATGATRHGNDASPIIDGEHLIAEVGGPGAGVVCFDKKTGKVVWKSQNDVAAY